MTTRTHDRTVWIRAVLAITLLVLASGSVAQAAADIFSVNFYAWGRTNQGANTEWNRPDWRETITLEPEQSAGVGDWETTGWVNYYVPWSPSAPQAPLTITSNQGSTATFTLITCRNGAPYHWTAKRTTLLGDGNGDLMDGHANATEQDDRPFEMVMSDIPFGEYDVIVYLGGNEGQWGDGTGKIVFNGGLEQDFYLGPNVEFSGFAEIVDATIPGNYIVYKGVKGPSFTLKVWGNGFNHLAPCGFQVRQASPALAADPSPADEATDVFRDVLLGWRPGQMAEAHDVYLSTRFEDVDAASRTDPRGILISQGQTETTCDPGRLAFNTTYYWRVDEVNAAPDNTIFKGKVWSFTTEPVAYPVDGQSITVTGSASELNQGPVNTINNSGLADDLHSENLTAMWLTASNATGPVWIQYEFDRVLRLYEVWVWNHNGLLEPMLGLGAKEVKIEYSTDGTDFETLGTTYEFARAPGKAGYACNTIVDLEGIAAKYVRFTILSNWGNVLKQYGLSEVRFYSVPVLAREPSPASAKTAVDVTSSLSWRAGREAATHTLYLSTDQQAVIDGTAPATIVASSVYTPALNLASTYYWRVDEVNEVETPSIWQGDLWSFSTREFVVVDDFESYTDDMDAEKAIFQTWIDGYEIAANGSQVGYGTSPFAERKIVHGGRQSMPFEYNNTTATYSEAKRTFDSPQDWTKHGIKTLTVWFYGDSANVAQQMYVKINNTKIPYDGEAANLTVAQWQMWQIDLTGLNVGSVRTLSIGFDRINGIGGAGKILIDDIRLSGPGTNGSLGFSVPAP
ncbi:MAG TPA: discoidin domain-containing protein [Sedimentisphaerales bacterium]|nr:discoidin domain-containing protein [Sedimentisphaerales bacterium]